METETIEENDSKYKLGKNSDGTYLTPYQTTVFYNTNPFETAVATLSLKSQPIPHLGMLNDNIDEIWAAVPQFITPDVLLFNKLYKYDAFFTRGFQRILIFVGECDKCGCGNCGDDGEISNCDEHKSLVDSKNIIIYFHLKNFYKYVQVEHGITPAYLMEYYLAFRFPSYSSENINNKTAKYLYRGMISELNNDKNTNLESVIYRMINSYKGFDKLIEYIAHGEAITNERMRLAENRFQLAERKLYKEYKYAKIYNGDLAGELQSIYICEYTKDLDFVVMDDFVNKKIIDLTNKLNIEDKKEIINLQ